MTRVIRAAGGLVFRSTSKGKLKVLIAHRPAYDDWSLPKGKSDKGETPEETAIREVLEETGYRCAVVRELEPVTYWFQREGQRIRKTVRWFLMRPLEKVGEHDHEVDEVRWATPEDALRLLRYDSDRRLLQSTS